MRPILMLTAASFLFATNALAFDGAPLAPGKPAGVRKAQMESINPLIYIGLAAVGIGVAFAFAGNDSQPSSVSTTSTSPSTTS
jgi:hypothetical protein